MKVSLLNHGGAARGKTSKKRGLTPCEASAYFEFAKRAEEGQKDQNAGLTPVRLRPILNLQSKPFKSGGGGRWVVNWGVRVYIYKE